MKINLNLKLMLIPGLALILNACTEQPQTPFIEVSAGTFQIEIEASGELDAIDSTFISVPPTALGAQTLSWIQPEFSQVKSGQVVARFDGSQFEIDLADANFELQKLDFSFSDKQRELNISLQNLSNQTLVVDEELDMAERFAIENELLYSRLEIIDSLSDKDYLNSQLDFLQQQGIHYQSKSAAEVAVLDTQKSNQNAIYQRNEQGLKYQEIVAPHDGIFVYKKNWFGQKTQVGQTIFPGFKIASLPDLSKMKAKVYVPEVEALGLKTGLRAELLLDAYPDRLLQGEVTNVSLSAQPKDRDSPVKYFMVDIVLNKADPSWLVPGQRLKANIKVASVDDAISVPNQAIFQDNGESWVYVEKDGTYQKRSIQIGLRSITRSQIEAGLNHHEKIALVRPEQAS